MKRNPRTQVLALLAAAAITGGLFQAVASLGHPPAAVSWTAKAGTPGIPARQPVSGRLAARS